MTPERRPKPRIEKQACVLNWLPVQIHKIRLTVQICMTHRNLRKPKVTSQPKTLRGPKREIEYGHRWEHICDIADIGYRST